MKNKQKIFVIKIIIGVIFLTIIAFLFTQKNTEQINNTSQLNHTKLNSLLKDDTYIKTTLYINYKENRKEINVETRDLLLNFVNDLYTNYKLTDKQKETIFFNIKKITTHYYIYN